MVALQTVILSIMVAGFVVWLIRYRRGSKKSKLPPGPNGSFLLNNILLFGQQRLYITIHKELRKTYKDYMTLWLLRQPFVIINDYRKLVELFVNNYPVETSNRPQIDILTELTEGNKSIFASNFGPELNFRRKMVHTALRKFAQNTNLDFYTRNAFGLFKNILLKNSQESTNGIFPYEESYLLSYNITCAIVLGKTYKIDDAEFMELRRRIEIVNKTFLENLVLTMIPYLHKLPFPTIRRLKSSFRYILDYLTRIVEEHERDHQFQESPRDVVDFILSEKYRLLEQQSDNVEFFDIVYIRQSLSDLFFAGTDTTAITMTWMLGLLTPRREILLRLRMEVTEFEQRVGRPVSVLDKAELPYTGAVALEILRFGIVAPIGGIHQLTTDCRLDDYILPKGCQVVGNQFEFAFDPVYWGETVNVFNPERFLGSDGSLLVHKDGFMPFGCGRRACLGEKVIKAELFLLLCLTAQELDFEWSPANGDKVDVEEKENNTQMRYVAPYLIKVTQAS